MTDPRSRSCATDGPAVVAATPTAQVGPGHLEQRITIVTGSTVSTQGRTADSAHALLIARHVARVDPGGERCEYEVTDVTVSSNEQHPLVLEIALTATVARRRHYTGVIRVYDRPFGPYRNLTGRDAGKVEFLGFTRPPHRLGGPDRSATIDPNSAEGSRFVYFALCVFEAYLDSNGKAPDPNEPAVPRASYYHSTPDGVTTVSTDGGLTWRSTTA